MGATKASRKRKLDESLQNEDHAGEATIATVTKDENQHESTSIQQGKGNANKKKQYVSCPCLRCLCSMTFQGLDHACYIKLGRLQPRPLRYSAVF